MQQTIKMNVRDISSHLESEDTFIQTNFDELVDDLQEGLLDRGFNPVSKSVLAAGDFIICIIDYMDMTNEQKNAYRKYKAERAGIHTDLNIDMSKIKVLKS